MNTTENELRGTCRAYNKELTAIANGEAWRVDGEIIISEDEPDGESVDRASFCDWLELRALGDTRYEVGSDRAYYGGKTLIAFGGPNIWLHDDRICGYWGADRVELLLSTDAAAMVDDYFREEWECIRGL